MNDFARTFSRLRMDRMNATVWMLAGAVVVLVAWFCWAVFVQVSLYEVSSEARVELDGATYPVASPFLGRIVATNLRVGQSVQHGDSCPLPARSSHLSGRASMGASAN
jgi:membrane fusion protein (multidrug efflux system)